MGESNFTQQLSAFRDYMYRDLLGGPHLLPMRYIINTFKGLTFIWVISLMYFASNYSTGMYFYLFLHGTYGMAWLCKDLIFPDASFKAKASLGSLLLLQFVLLLWVLLLL